MNFYLCIYVYPLEYSCIGDAWLDIDNDDSNDDDKDGDDKEDDDDDDDSNDGDKDDDDDDDRALNFEYFLLISKIHRRWC